MRTFMRLIILTTLCVGIFSFATKRSTHVSTTTPAVQGESAQSSPTPLPSSSLIPSQPISINHASCASTAAKTSAQAHAFMQSHQQRNATTVISLLSPPATTEETLDRSVLLGTDTPDGPRLYTLTQFSYQTTAYKLGAVQQNGQDTQERGAIRCTYPVYETRTADGTTGHTETTVTRYLDFAVDEIGNATLTAFKDSPLGKKYSGFN